MARAMALRQQDMIPEIVAQKRIGPSQRRADPKDRRAEEPE
jgi:hypothetical protein